MQRADLVRVGQAEVDIRAIYGVFFKCDAMLCRDMESCCSRYEVVIDHTEREKLLGLLPACGAFQPLLMGDNGPQNPFDDSSDEGLYAVDKDEDGCVIAHGGEHGETACSFHAAALSLGLDPLANKPLACALWPLVYVESDPVIVGLDDDVFDFPCATRKKKPDGRLPRGFEQSLSLIFSSDWLRELDHLARRLLLESR